MPIIHRRNVLRGLKVREAMRRQVISLPTAAPLEQAVRYSIKYKVNALLITDDSQAGVGVVSKTDLMAAYFGGLPINTPVAAVMTGPPLFCGPDETLDAALEVMRSHRVHRLYVESHEPGLAVGVLAYPDIVGLLYRFCSKCDKKISLTSHQDEVGLDQFRVREVMTPQIQAFAGADSLATVMAGLAASRFGAVLIQDAHGPPLGVVSKTDLILAYKHGLDQEQPASAIMKAPVLACASEDPLYGALRQMVFWDVHRLFVHRDSPENLIGVLSLSDVARFRSGTCRACLISRIKM